jgi:hypothetical protein
MLDDPLARADLGPAFPLVVELIDRASERSSLGDASCVEELLGLSPDLLPGIFVRKAVLKLLADSRVSDLLKEG